MLDQILDLVKGFGAKEVVENPDVPNEHNNEVLAEATNTVTGGLQNILSGGGLQNIMSLFSSGSNKNSLMSNPIVNMMVGHFAGKLMNKFGIQNNKASGIAASLIPNILSGLISKTQDPNNNSFTMDNLLQTLTGGQSQQVAQQQGGGFSFQNLLNQFTGGGGQQQQPQSGGGGIMDLIGSLAGGAQKAQGGGGIMDMIKGFMK